MVCEIGPLGQAAGQLGYEVPIDWGRTKGINGQVDGYVGEEVSFCDGRQKRISSGPAEHDLRAARSFRKKLKMQSKISAGSVVPSRLSIVFRFWPLIAEIQVRGAGEVQRLYTKSDRIEYYITWFDFFFLCTAPYDLWLIIMPVTKEVGE